MHFFNPAPRMKLIEVIKGLRTSDTHVDYITNLVKRWGKAPVITKSTPGFIVNRVARPFYGEALRVLTELGADHISLDIELKNADRNRLTRSLMKSSHLQDQEVEDADQGASNIYPEDSEEGGRIDFSLQAEGPLSEPRHFEGSGNFDFYDVEIGTMHLLGGIRSKLGAFNLPLPSDALSFNRLNAPFLLDHDRILFDQATLSGPLSTFDAKGEVNWVNSDVDLLADLKLAGNLKIPILKQLVNLADPLSKLSTLKIKGDWENPEWTIHLKTNPLKP